MIRRIPIVATLVVVLAVAAMVALGVWQLGRLEQKRAAMVAWRANMTLPATAYPAMNPADDRLLFRTLSANCLRVTGWQVT
ncbi:MAG TPA: SURF1 family cytochrome oxidase biogenesis protein, partial [Sphingobium sp.]|nr:SURF1 family cytochrome oxidase biogenesis protein [Sphingobium sp.]